MRANLFLRILLPIIVFGILQDSLAENDKSNLQNTAANQPQTNGVDHAIKYKRLKEVRTFQKEWVNPEKRQSQRLTIYQAIYRSGDWNCNSNAFINLAVAVSNLTQGRVRLTCDTIDIGTDKLFSMKPSFIYFTGNKDFTFQESEIKNFKDYMYLGGTVWIDSANPGRNTPFDIAVRREFARVLPNREFKQVTSNSFRNANRIYDSYFKGIGLCPGAKGSAEPIEAIKLGDELGVIYTLNGYGTMWEMFSNIDNPSKPNDTGDDSLTQEAIINNMKFGFNIVQFLFTRWSQ